MGFIIGTAIFCTLCYTISLMSYYKAVEKYKELNNKLANQLFEQARKMNSNFFTCRMHDGTEYVINIFSFLSWCNESKIEIDMVMLNHDLQTILDKYFAYIEGEKILSGITN